MSSEENGKKERLGERGERCACVWGRKMPPFLPTIKSNLKGVSPPLLLVDEAEAGLESFAWGTISLLECTVGCMVGFPHQREHAGRDDGYPGRDSARRHVEVEEAPIST